jgi:predicted secreted protein
MKAFNPPMLGGVSALTWISMLLLLMNIWNIVLFSLLWLGARSLAVTTVTTSVAVNHLAACYVLE